MSGNAYGVDQVSGLAGRKPRIFSTIPYRKSGQALAKTASIALPSMRPRHRAAGDARGGCRGRASGRARADRAEGTAEPVKC
jgi:hypothetical protein